MITEFFAYFDSIETVKSLKLSMNKQNTAYCYNCSEVSVSGTPDIGWDTLIFIGTPRSFWTHGKLFKCEERDDSYDDLDNAISRLQSERKSYTYARYFRFDPTATTKFYNTSTETSNSVTIHQDATSGGYVAFYIGNSTMAGILARVVSTGSICQFEFFYQGTHYLVSLNADESITYITI